MTVSAKQITWGFQGNLKEAYYGVTSFNGASFEEPISIFIHNSKSDSGKFITHVLDEIDSILDIDFVYSSSPSDAVIEIKQSSFDGTKAGLTTTSYGHTTFNNSKTYSLDVLVEWENEGGTKLKDYSTLSEFSAHTILHEIAHALGLDHPDKGMGSNGSDGDPYGNWHSTADTVMSYNFKKTGSSTPFYTNTDVEALKMLWKEESDSLTSANKSDISTSKESENIIQSKKGVATLKGTSKSDTFVFKTKNQYGKSAADTIIGFKKASGDKIMLDADVFSGISDLKFKSVNSKKQLQKEKSKSSNIVYYDKPTGSKKGELYYDENGKKKGWGKGGLFAYLVGSPKLGKSQFLLSD